MQEEPIRFLCQWSIFLQKDIWWKIYYFVWSNIQFSYSSQSSARILQKGSKTFRLMGIQLQKKETSVTRFHCKNWMLVLTVLWITGIRMSTSISTNSTYELWLWFEIVSDINSSFWNINIILRCLKNRCILIPYRLQNHSLVFVW